MIERWTADRTEREVARFIQQSLALDELSHGLAARLSKHVPMAGSCWHTMDPATVIFTTGYTEGFDRESGFPLLVENEFFVPDVNKFRWLARQRRPVGTLHQATGGRPDRSPRYATLSKPYGYGDEIRAVFRVGGSSWAAVIGARHAGDKTFSAADIDFFARIGPLVAAAYRRVLISRHAEMEQEADGPGLVILDGHGRIESATPAGHSWLDQLGHDVCTRGLQTAVNAVEAVARASAIGRVSAPARLRVRTRAGHWLVLHASLLDGRHDGRVGVILEPAHPAEVASILLEGYGLTAREREVVALVLQGRSTREMAWSLGLSPYTVQDHLKSIFGKFGVGSRSELVGRVFHRDYLPRLDRTPVAADGFFAGLPEPAAEIRSSPPRLG